MRTLDRLLLRIKQFLPLLVITAISFVVAILNMPPGSYFAGWDNILAELNFGRYANQIFFGAWMEYQGLGAPAIQAHLAEIPRLPFLWISQLLLPTNLVRYSQIFVPFWLGGIGMYLYLIRIWLPKTNGGVAFKHRTWYLPLLATIGALFYQLHLFTVQQFYIAFEMFAIQFGLLPFAFLSLHWLLDKQSSQKTTLAVRGLAFFVIQLLLAPSAHTPTVFYLGTLFLLLYSFIYALPQGLIKSARRAFLIGCLIFFSHSYWIVPNVYYSLEHSNYFSESRNVALFSPETYWSVKEASTWDHFFANTHYLFKWQDYSFEKNQYELIFQEWIDHLDRPLIFVLSSFLTFLTLVGLLLSLFRFKRDANSSLRLAISSIFIFTISLIWIDLFPTKVLIEWLFQFEEILTIFRNPFTKLSIILTFSAAVLFTHSLAEMNNLIQHLQQRVNGILADKLRHLQFIFPLLVVSVIGMVSAPVFQGQLLNEKLRVTFPPQYDQLSTFLSTQPETARILQLPQRTHAGWEFYDWRTFVKAPPGATPSYQGMGFYFFGFGQPFLARDFDRWVDTSDFFYHELKYALDRHDPNQLDKILDKYEVDFIVIDETRIDPFRSLDYQESHELVLGAGLAKIWHKDFLSVYQTSTKNQSADTSTFLIPESIALVDQQSSRWRYDSIFHTLGDYIVATLASEQERLFSLPFADLASPEIPAVTFQGDKSTLTRTTDHKEAALRLPAYSDNEYTTPAAIRLSSQSLNISFPQVSLTGTSGDTSQTLQLPQLADLELPWSEIASAAATLTDENSAKPSPESVVNKINTDSKAVVFFNDIGIIVEKNQLVLPTLSLPVGKEISIAIAPFSEEFLADPDGILAASTIDAVPVTTLEPDWAAITAEILTAFPAQKLSVQSSFPTLTLDLAQNPAVNCSLPLQGNISRTPLTSTQNQTQSGYRYQADDYGVNCNGYRFDYVSPAGSYLLRIAGSNTNGRGTKLFLNYLYPVTMPEEYLLPEKSEFDLTFAVHQISTDVQSAFQLNWETRSFGGTSINDLTRAELRAFPLERISQLQLLPPAVSQVADLKQHNNLELQAERTIFPGLHFAEIRCEVAPCWLGIDQSYDQAWLAVQLPTLSLSDLGSAQLLPHTRLNTWANVWQISPTSQPAPDSQIPQTQVVIVFYLFELLQLLLQFVLWTCLVVVSLIVLKQKLIAKKS